MSRTSARLSGRVRIHAPPPPSWRIGPGGGPFGASLLVEGDGPLALSLWLALRAVWTWAETSPERRFRRPPIRASAEAEARRGEARAAAPELAPALDCLALLARRPSVVTHVEVADACTAISEWADHHRLRDTSVAFGEAAAQADPENPLRANLAGRLCRRGGFSDRAAVWLARGFRLAVNARDDEASIRAQLGYGTLMKEVGRGADARLWFRRAARRAIRTGRRRQAAEAYHDLLALAAEEGRLDEVETYAVRALEFYPLYHPRLPYLAHDFGFVLTRLGLFTPALPLLDAFISVVPERALLPGLGTLAHAAAGCGLGPRFDGVAERARWLLHRDSEYGAATLINLAEGARLLGRWSQAEQLVREAIAATAARFDPLLDHDEQVLLASILERRAAPAPTAIPSSDLPRIIREFKLRLRRWRPAEPSSHEGVAGVSTREAAGRV